MKNAIQYNSNIALTYIALVLSISSCARLVLSFGLIVKNVPNANFLRRDTRLHFQQRDIFMSTHRFEREITLYAQSFLRGVYLSLSYELTHLTSEYVSTNETARK
jgi:hypothetical protein